MAHAAPRDDSVCRDFPGERPERPELPAGCGRGKVHVRRTPYFEPQTEENQRVIDLTSETMEALSSFQKQSKSEFLL